MKKIAKKLYKYEVRHQLNVNFILDAECSGSILNRDTDEEIFSFTSKAEFNYKITQ
jgi:hypothetical protein